MPASERRRSVAVNSGAVKVGGSNPIVVQSMTNTDTAHVQSTVNQVMALANAGSELVRVTVNTEEAARAVPKIAETLDKFGVRVPVIGDFRVMSDAAVEYQRPVRIGVNWGSLDQALLTRMMDENSRAAEPADAKTV